VQSRVIFSNRLRCSKARQFLCGPKSSFFFQIITRKTQHASPALGNRRRSKSTLCNSSGPLCLALSPPLCWSVRRAPSTKSHIDAADNSITAHTCSGLEHVLAVLRTSITSGLCSWMRHVAGTSRKASAACPAGGGRVTAHAL